MAIDSKKPPPAQQPTYGPYLQCLGSENENAQWLGSILLVASYEQAPLLVFQDGDLQPYSLNPILLDTFGTYRCELPKPYYLESDTALLRVSKPWRPTDTHNAPLSSPFICGTDSGASASVSRWGPVSAR